MKQDTRSGEQKSAKQFPKTDARYWREKVFTRSNDEYHCQIAFGNRQERWPLKTSNKDNAATKARDIYLSLMANGHAATRAKFKPWEVEAELNRIEHLTVGDYIEAARVVFPGKPTTFLSYERKFRFLVAQLAGMKADKSKFDPTKGHKRFRKTIESTLLESITPTRVETWRLKYLKAAGRNPLKQQSARVSAASIIQNCRALFAKKILKQLRSTNIKLPCPLPLDGVEKGKLPRARYRSKVNIQPRVTRNASRSATMVGAFAPARAIRLRWIYNIRRRRRRRFCITAQPRVSWMASANKDCSEWRDMTCTFPPKPK